MANDRDRTSRASYYDKSREEIAQLNAYEQAMIAANKGRVPTTPTPTPTPAPASGTVNTSTPNYDEYVRNNMKNAGARAYEGKASGLDRVVTPAPVQEQTTPVQPVTTSPYQDFAKLWSKPITPEEEARRERAARAVQGVAGLGNLMSAFANLTFTGKGAPSQTIPTQSVDAMSDKMTAWKDKLKAEREKYQAAELGAKVEQWKAELDAQHRAQAQANADRAHEENVRQFNERMAKEDAERKAAQDRWEKQYQQSLEQQRVANNQAQQRLAISQQQADTAEKRAAAYANYQDWRVSGGGSSQNWAKPIEVKDAEGNNKVAYINQKAINDSNLQQIVETLPEELRKKHGLKGDWSDATVLGAFDEKVSRAIGEAVKDVNSDTFHLMERLGLISVSNGVPSLEDKVGSSVNDDNLPPSKRAKNNNNLPPSKRNQ